MAINRKLDYVILDLIETASRNVKSAPLILGGLGGPGGGVGQPPGGYVGYLPQTRVAYDEDEIASSGLPASGWSLLDNLNHIRYRIGTLESGSTPGTIYVVDDNTPATISEVDTIHFSGAGVTVLDLGAGDVRVTITSSGVSGSGVSTFIELSDTPTSYSGNAGKSVVVNPTEDGLVFSTISGISAEETLHYYNDDLTSQIPSGIFTTTLVYKPETLRVYYNGIRQRKDYNYTELSGYHSFEAFFTTYSGDIIAVDYDYFQSSQPSTEILTDSDGIVLLDSLGNELTESL